MRRLVLVLAFDDQRVEEVEAGRPDAHDDLARRGSGDGVSTTASFSGGPSSVHNTALIRSVSRCFQARIVGGPRPRGKRQAAALSITPAILTV